MKTIGKPIVIMQDEAIALRIIQKQESMSLEDLLTGFTVEEWEEYLKFILFINYDPRGKKPNFEFDFTHHFEHNFGNSRSDTDNLFATFECFDEGASPAVKKVFSEAVNNLIVKNINNAPFIQIIVESLYYYLEGHDDTNMGSFYFDGLKLVVESDLNGGSTRWTAITALLSLEGNERPSDIAIMRTLIDWRDRFRSDNQSLGSIVECFLEIGNYKEAFLTLRCVSKSWPESFDFEESLIRAINQESVDYPDKTVTVEFLATEIIPRMEKPIRNKLVRILRKNYCSQQKFAKKQDEAYAPKFPASQEEIEMIKSLK